MGWSSVSLLSAAGLSVSIVCLPCPLPVPVFLSMSAYALTLCPYDSSPCMSLPLHHIFPISSPCPHAPPYYWLCILLIPLRNVSVLPTYVPIPPYYIPMPPTSVPHPFHVFHITYFQPSLCLPMPLPISPLSLSLSSYPSLSLHALYLLIFGGHRSLLVGPLIPLFWTSGDVSWFQSQSGQPFSCLGEGVCVSHLLQFTSCVTPANLLAAIMTAEPFSFMYLWVGIGGTWNQFLSYFYPLKVWDQVDALLTEPCWLGFHVHYIYISMPLPRVPMF